MSHVCGVCKLDKDGKVLHKNAVARDVCSVPSGERCVYIDISRQANKIGFSAGGIITMDRVHLDHVFLETEEGFTVFLCDVSSQLNDIISEEESASFTKTEKVIVKFVLKKMSNAEIDDLLCISKATLKTHLSHIYQKAPHISKWRRKNRS